MSAHGAGTVISERSPLAPSTLIGTKTRRVGIDFKRIRRWSIGIVVLLILLACAPAPAKAVPANRYISFPHNTPSSTLTGPAELEDFIDRIMAVHIQAYHIPGAAVTVVKDGKLAFAKGYGYADIERRTPVDPERHLFHLASVTKLFTWTAVMQLVERGQLDLNADVNTYLDFKIPATYPEPITLTHLMAHTAGFEDVVIGGAYPDVEEVPPLGTWLATHLPARIAPPGAYCVYSNYGTALAGYIVERVSGMPYAQYVEEHILKLLGMTHSTAQQPLPVRFSGDLAIGYTESDGDLHPFTQFMADTPSGGMNASATDMAHFMIAYLGDGCYGGDQASGSCILKRETVAQMRTTLYTRMAPWNGNAHGFWEIDSNGQQIIGHEGGDKGVRTKLALLPEQGVGFFVAYNGDGGNDAQPELWRAFLDRYYPAPKSETPDHTADFAARAKRYTGYYAPQMSSFTTITKLYRLLFGMRIDVDKQGLLLLNGGEDTLRFVEIEPLVFREIDGNDVLIFSEGDHGAITHAYLNSDPEFPYDKVAWYETQEFSAALVLICLAVFVSMIVAWAVDAFARRRSGYQAEQSRLPRVARALAAVVALLGTLFAAAFAVLMDQTVENILFGIPVSFQIALALPVVMATLTLAAAGFAVLAWRHRYWRVPERVHYTGFVLAALAYIWFLNNWNLLGWQS